ncbi:MAG TPA: OsmC family peroxiredoxin [Bacteroidetes bacterium]|nr:OsmC family peroxiredoxin [Bacteroidota bacterium]
MKELVNVTWLDHLGFEVQMNGHRFPIDADPEVGGNNRGPKPKPLMMAALGGCTGMDVVSILKKMRVDIESLNIRVEGYLTEEHPKHYYKMEVIFEFTGKDLPEDKIKKAVSLSEERYCGVSVTYRKAMELSTRILINGKELK